MALYSLFIPSSVSFPFCCGQSTLTTVASIPNQETIDMVDGHNNRQLQECGVALRREQHYCCAGISGQKPLLYVMGQWRKSWRINQRNKSSIVKLNLVPHFEDTCITTTTVASQYSAKPLTGKDLNPIHYYCERRGPFISYQNHYFVVSFNKQTLKKSLDSH